MAKKKDEKKHKDEKKQKKPVGDGATPQPEAADAGAGNRENDMRRIAREAAWARMFGKNANKNPFGDRA